MCSVATRVFSVICVKIRSSLLPALRVDGVRRSSRLNEVRRERNSASCSLSKWMSCIHDDEGTTIRPFSRIDDSHMSSSSVELPNWPGGL